MPVLGLRVLHFDTSQRGLLFTSLGAGSVAGATFIIPWLRGRYSSNTLITLANLLVVLVYVSMAFVRPKEPFFVVAALAGFGWTLSASELWVAAQRAMPGWARGRMNATVIMVSRGAMALGGIIWGTIAATAGVNTALIVQASAIVLVLVIMGLLGNPWSIDFTTTADLNAVPATVMNVGYKMLYRPDPKDGPVLVTQKFELNRAGG